VVDQSVLVGEHLATATTPAIGRWATSTGKYNAGLSFNIDRNHWGCATSRDFRQSLP
jgi:hypothetical protein